MKYQLGEFVRFVDEKREGYITKIISEEMVGVTGEDDFEIPVMINNLTRVHGHKTNPESNKTDLQNITEEQDFIEKGIFLSAITDKNKASIVHFYLVNLTSYQILTTFKTSLKQVFKGEFADKISSNSSSKIYSASLAELDVWPQFHFQALYFTSQDKPQLKPLTFDISFKAKDFAGSKTQIPVISENGWLFKMDEATIKIDAEKLKEAFFKPSEEKKQVGKPAKEIDLHIEKLRDDFHFLNKQEMLDIQLAKFQEALDAAIVHQFDKIIFIHGTGNGTLQHQIHKMISKHPQVKTFMDAKREKFGYGATEVVFK
ncbi:DNA mismatch repair protein MutS [Pedobacter psychrophilus]|uniref:DNA mismatch repair protein MutS n=1 Tax=Pedobacter psychrophilus TaxID=1826909 RepID=A0A179DE49_9SPHI|nr:Smr/MutS family protein [Pedobacter psychrophilus]OAQ38753.1 DNA mismatch repair protein MutS [Pedobacter psychrophilus]